MFFFFFFYVKKFLGQQVYESASANGAKVICIALKCMIKGQQE